MTESESMRRPMSNRALLLIATVVVLYALGLYLRIGTAVGRLNSGDHVVCGRLFPTFANPGRMGWGHGFEPQDSTGRLVVVRHHRFPYSLAGHLRYMRDEFPVTALGLRPDDAGWTHLPRVDGHPLRVKKSFIWKDKLLVWGEYQLRPDTKPVDVHYVLDAQGQHQVVRNRQRLHALAIETSTSSLVSIEERVRIMGGQPREEERPPQALVIEHLDEDGTPRSEGAHRHPIRKLQNLLSDDQGQIFLVRWQAGPMSLYQSRYGHRLLEAYSIAERRILWSVRLDDDPVPEHAQRPSRIALGKSGIRFETDYLIPLDDVGREFKKKWRARIYDRTSGAYVGEEISAVPKLDLDRREELAIAGQRYAVSKRGRRKDCLAITPIASQ